MKTNLLSVALLFMAIILLQCNSKKSDNAAEHSSSVEAESAKSYKLVKAWASDTLLKTPESVIYDPEQDVLYVSNVNMNPWEKDENGFISKMSTTGEILELEWVTGMNGPKGMAIVGTTLYAADMDELVSINTETGELIDKLKIDGASGLNDITPGPNGSIFFTDSQEGKIFQFADNEVTYFQETVSGGPNGLYMDQGNLLNASFGSSEFASYDLKTKERKMIAEEIGGGDGITQTNEEGVYLVSDWNGEIFIIDVHGNKQSLLRTIDEGINAADIWFIEEQNLVLVPTFFDNRIIAYKLVKE